MKNWGFALALAVCLSSSLALADNPSDAPLGVDDSNTTVVQKNNLVGHERLHANKKQASQPSTARRENASDNNNCRTDEGNTGHPSVGQQVNESN